MRQGRPISQLSPAPVPRRPRSHAHAIEAERAKTRAWLHDSVLQLLEYVVAGGYADSPDGEEMRRVVGLAADELRRFVDDDAPAAPPRTLTRALADAARDARRMAGSLRIRIVVGPLGPNLPPEVADALAGAAREALVNAAKHADASHATVRCAVADGAVSVLVEDDGAGFDTAGVLQGCGLRDSITGRLTRVGGSALVDSTPGAGTRVTLTVPLSTAPALVATAA